MKIFINYDSSWENSFLDSSIEEGFNENRKYIGSGSQGYESYKNVKISKKTVLGILHRLIGDQRRLFQIESSNNNFFKNIEHLINFSEKEIIENNEIAFLRNINTSSFDQTAMSGVKKPETNEIFTNKYFHRFWAPLFMELEDLLELLDKGMEKSVNVNIEQSRYAIGNYINTYTEKNKRHTGDKIKDCSGLTKTEDAIKKMLIKNNYLTKEDLDKGLSYKILVYCSLYKIAEKLLKEDASFSKNLTESFKIQGIAKRSFTLKDFLKGSATPKRVIGNPSTWDGFTKEEGVSKYKQFFLKKKSGKLEIDIDVDPLIANDIKTRIDNAGVLSFNLGKKGLAYIEKILI